MSTAPAGAARSSRRAVAGLAIGLLLSTAAGASEPDLLARAFVQLEAVHTLRLLRSGRVVTSASGVRSRLPEHPALWGVVVLIGAP